MNTIQHQARTKTVTEREQTERGHRADARTRRVHS